LILFIFSTYSYSQNTNNNIDSFLKLASEESILTKKIDYLTKAYELSHEKSLYHKEEVSLLKLIETLNNLNLNEQVYRYSLKLQYLYENNQEIPYTKLASIRYDIGILLFEKELYVNAKNSFLGAEQIFHNIDDISLKENCFKYIGDISAINKKNSEAIIWYRKSLQQSKKEHNLDRIYLMYQLIGLQYQKAGLYDSGIIYYENILGQLNISESDNTRGILHNNLGILYSKNKEKDLAELHFRKTLKLIAKEEKFANILAKANINLAIILQSKQAQSEALTHISKAEYLSSLNNNQALKNEIYFIKSNVYYYLGDFYNAQLYIDKTIAESTKSHNRILTSSALLFKSKIYATQNNYESERDFKTSYLQEENKINNENIIHKNKIEATRINFERIEKDALVFQKKSAEEIAEIEKSKADKEAQKARESRILRDRAIALAQNEIDKNKIIEIEKDAAIYKSRRDSLFAANAIAKEENAIQKSRSDSIATVLAVQKQKIAQKEANNATEILQRSRLIGLLLVIILIIIIIGFGFQRRLNNRITKEKNKSDKLLLNILPKRVANELKQNSKVSPKKYEKVSVLFTDFVGFTSIAELLSEDELIKELDRYFNEFDKIIEKYNLEKIKTIGDSYMCAGGVPTANSTNALDSVNAGLEIAKFVQKDVLVKKKLGKPYWNIRIGINTGSVIAGVVGSKKFAYDIWGDTVNIASRIESSGLEGFVNISESTYNEVKEEFNCISRGMIIAKNKGAVPMFYIQHV